MDEKIEEKIWTHALRNAILHKGEARLESVISGLMSEGEEIEPKEIMDDVKEIIKEVNELSVNVQKKEAEKLGVKIKKEKEVESGLPVVENEVKGGVITRAAPNPNGPFHLGNSRAYILSYLYADRNDGRFILRYDDTDPATPEKSPQKEFYDWIEEDLEWLGCKPDLIIRASDRIDVYYNITKELLDNGDAYVCTCKNVEWRELRDNKKACPCRDISQEKNAERWYKMIDGVFGEGEAVVRIKTDIKHKNPAIRDWPALRIIDDHNHPMVEEDYKVWPLYNFASAIDDHEFNITHIFRAEEHSSNTEKQKWLYKHMGWEYPITIHHGFLSLKDAILSTSKIRNGIESGKYKGWDDPRLGTIRALRRRGFQPETIRDLIIKYGPKKANATVSMETIKSINRKKIDKQANRYFFISEPVEIVIEKPLKQGEIELPLHPDKKTCRKLVVDEDILIEKTDFSKNKNKEIRLKDLYNIEIKETKKTISTNNKIVQEMPKIHWLPAAPGQTIKTKVVKEDGEILEGISEKNVLEEEIGSVIQFERFGFLRLDQKTDSEIVLYFTHR